MKIKNEKVSISTQKQVEFVDITEQVEEIVQESGVKSGQALVFSPHSTASVAINHKEDMLLQDMSRILYRLAPVDERYDHDVFELTKKNKSDGRSNGHSHCKNFLLGTSETIPVQDGKLMLGDRQNIFLVEFDGGRERDYIVQVLGE
ncbi:MAG: secondary thiamine-phosphate synthase enzyme YjbQ [Candidatus Moranbacteria bacterium]|nr:secondary thiamine-phosphate synthase enzyme YjbQ [Candidatus Moranbacteria bacterium]